MGPQPFPERSWICRYLIKRKRACPIKMMGQALFECDKPLAIFFFDQFFTGIVRTPLIGITEQSLDFSSIIKNFIIAGISATVAFLIFIHRPHSREIVLDHNKPLKGTSHEEVPSVLLHRGL